VGTDGKYVGGALQQTTVRTFTAAAGQGVALHPWFVARVISLRTVLPRGPSSNGRLYWPAIGTSVTPVTSLCDPTSTQSMATAAAAMIAAINTAASANVPGNQGVYVMSAVGLGSAAPVTSVRIGRVLDAQRRRLNDVPEDYRTAAVTGAFQAQSERDRVPFDELEDWRERI